MSVTSEQPDEQELMMASSKLLLFINGEKTTKTLILIFLQAVQQTQPELTPALPCPPSSGMLLD